MNRGSLDRADDSRILAGRFNEAPIHESGKCGQQGTPCIGPYRFNEAPIHESGKCDKLVNRRVEMNRFNEAPIHESGKSSAYATTNEATGGLQ